MDIWDNSNREPSNLLKGALASAYSLFIAINIASGAGWLGATNAQISARFTVPLTPAGWAFSIWGLIFLLQGLGTVYACIHSGYDPDGFKQRPANAVGWPWVGSWLSACAWQFAFVQQTPSGMWLAAVLISLSLIFMAHGLSRLYSQSNVFGSSNSTLVYAAFFLPTSISAAWLSVATTVQFLIAMSSQFHNLDVYSLAFAVIVTGVGLWVLLAHKDTAYGLTLLWALVAVYEKTESIAVQHGCLLAIAVVLLGCLASVLKRRERDDIAVGDWEARQPLQSNGEPSSSV